MIWTDSLDIAICLYEKYPDIDPINLNFVDLKQMVIDLEDFDDNPEHSGEKILEAIQMYWIEEKK
jgi:FeS assembly protein IscX